MGELKVEPLAAQTMVCIKKEEEKKNRWSRWKECAKRNFRQGVKGPSHNRNQLSREWRGLCATFPPCLLVGECHAVVPCDMMSMRPAGKQLATTHLCDLTLGKGKGRRVSGSLEMTW